MVDPIGKIRLEVRDGRKDFPNYDILDIELRAWKMYFDGVVN